MDSFDRCKGKQQGRHFVGFRGSQFKKNMRNKRSAEKNLKHVRVWIRGIVEVLGNKFKNLNFKNVYEIVYNLQIT